MLKAASHLRSLYCDWEIITIREVCRGCSSPSCVPFKAFWGENAPARFSYSVSYIKM